jgi:hypothetical protein
MKFSTGGSAARFFKIWKLIKCLYVHGNDPLERETADREAKWWEGQRHKGREAGGMVHGVVT